MVGARRWGPVPGLLSLCADRPLRNETRHGLATFLYDDTRVSALRFQVVQENVPWRDKYDGWGQAPMTYAPGPIAHEEALRAQFAAELQQQIADPAVVGAAGCRLGAPVLAGFDGDTAPDDLKVSGVIVDGVLYLRGCETRAGPYPYCREMRHGVFSVTKSLGGRGRPVAAGPDLRRSGLRAQDQGVCAR